MSFWSWVKKILAVVVREILCPDCGVACSQIRGIPGQYRCPKCGKVVHAS